MMKPLTNNINSFLGLFYSFILKNRPVYVHYGITHRCNLRCRMCHIYQDAEKNEELSLDQIEGIFNLLRRLGIIYVSLGGGEPLLRKDLSQVVGLLIKKGFMVRLLTNGTLVNEKENLIRELVSIGLKEASVSLDTLDAQKQAFIGNDTGIWEKRIQAIDLFSNILPKKGRLLLINTVVSPFNIRELPQLSQFAKRKGCYISFVPVESDGLPEFTFTQAEHRWINESYDYLIESKRNNKSPIFNSSLFLDKSRQYLKSGQHNWQCDAGKLYFSINPQGGLSICHRFKPIYPLLEGYSKDMLKSEEFMNNRKNLVNKCPGCMRPCWAEVSFLFRDKRSLWEMMRMKSL